MPNVPGDRRSTSTRAAYTSSRIRNVPSLTRARYYQLVVAAGRRAREYDDMGFGGVMSFGESTTTTQGVVRFEIY